MNFEEAMARELCSIDGFDPNATGDFSVKVIRDGRLTDTGHDTRKGHVETVTAPPLWQSYVPKARKISMFLADIGYPDERGEY